MAKRVIQDFEVLRSLVGQPLGESDWLRIDQERIDAFAACTGDRQWIHTDPQRAAHESPFGGTIAHGYLTLSLVSQLLHGTVEFSGTRLVVNYGLNRVRFPAPMRSGERVRMRTELLSVETVEGAPGWSGVQIACRNTFEVEGGAKPVCVAETVFRLFA